MQTEIRTAAVKKESRAVIFFAALHMKSSLNGEVGEKTSRRVPGKALGKVTANEGFIS